MRYLGRTLLYGAILLSILSASFHLGKKSGIAEGRSIAMKEALRTNPPSEELEMVCAGLWIGEQNRRYFEKKR